MHGCLSILISLLPLVSLSQHSAANDTVRVTRQCSFIRELVYQASHQHFAGITDAQMRTSEGHQTLGTWKFATTRYNVAMQWEGAARTYLEHNEESTDSFATDVWQYIAEYNQISTGFEAERLYRQLNSQIEGCQYPLNDSVEVNFKPLPLDLLPAKRPDYLEVASVYELPSDTAASKDLSCVIVMVGMERKPKSYCVSMIVEYRKETGKANH